MTKLVRRMRRKDAFTLVELMIVVTIVAILALIAIPLYSANTTAAIMSEGVAGAGTMRTALRTYYSQNGSYTGATYPGTLTVGAEDLQGQVFRADGLPVAQRDGLDVHDPGRAAFADDQDDPVLSDQPARLGTGHVLHEPVSEDDAGTETTRLGWNP